MSRSLSVVIPHYGDAAQTLGLVESLTHQKGCEPFQIVVSDDCSPERFPAGEGYDLVRRDVNGGYGSACNSGASVAGGDDLLFLNSDVRIGDDFIATLLDQARPWLPAIVSPAIRQGAGLSPVPRRWPRPRHYAAWWLVPARRHYGSEWFQRLGGFDAGAMRATTPQVVDWVAGVAHLVPAAQFRDVGGFDERFFMNSEEVDLHRRLHEREGLRAVYLPGVTAAHAGGGSTDPGKSLAWLTESWFIYFHKWGGQARLLSGLALASVVNLLTRVVQRARSRDAHPLGGLVFDAMALGHGWRARKGFGPAT